MLPYNPVTCKPIAVTWRSSFALIFMTICVVRCSPPCCANHVAHHAAGIRQTRRYCAVQASSTSGSLAGFCNCSQKFHTSAALAPFFSMKSTTLAPQSLAIVARRCSVCDLHFLAAGYRIAYGSIGLPSLLSTEFNATSAAEERPTIGVRQRVENTCNSTTQRVRSKRYGYATCSGGWDWRVVCHLNERRRCCDATAHATWWGGLVVW